MAYEVIVFDMDGTLVDTDLMLVEAMMVLFRKYRPDFKISLSTLIYFSGPPIEDTLATYFPHIDQRALIQEFKDVSFSYYEKDAMLFPETEATLRKLHERGIRLAVFTNKHHDRTLATLRMFGIERYFDYVVGYDDLAHPKPHPEGLLRCLEHFKVTREQLLFFGDTIYDYEAAKAAGVPSALTAWTLRKFPNHVRPTHWIGDYRQLLEVSGHGNGL